MKKIALSASFIAAIASISSVAYATTTTETLGVSASVSNSCTIASGASLSFGTLGLTAGQTDAAATGATTITVTCTVDPQSGATLSFGNGSNYDSGNSIRQLANSHTDLIAYTINSYASSTCGSEITTDTTLTFSSGVASVSICGKIAAGQTITGGGGYSDSVTMTVDYTP